jgi:nicotinamide riboside kinase
MQQLKKIVVIGPESTGKSTLCAQLAQHYGTVWVREYAREYLLQHGMDYGYEDLLTIAQGQVALEEEGMNNVELRMKNEPNQSNTQYGEAKLATASGASRPNTPIPQYPIPIFIDTDMHVMKVWCEFVFGKTHAWIEEQLRQRQYDLYLLCNTDLPWVKDELREYPDLQTREKLFAIYKERMQQQQVPWAEIGGGSGERLQRAIMAVDAFFG